MRAATPPAIAAAVELPPIAYMIAEKISPKNVASNSVKPKVHVRISAALNPPSLLRRPSMLASHHTSPETVTALVVQTADIGRKFSIPSSYSSEWKDGGGSPGRQLFHA